MSEDAVIRRDNLKRLCHARKWTPKDLHSRLGGTYPYWRDILEDNRKPFGEKAARRIEAGLELPRGWLDQLLPVPAENKVEAPQATYEVIRAKWPFSPELFTAVSACTPEELRRLENTLRAQFDLQPLAAKGKRRAA